MAPVEEPVGYGKEICYLKWVRITRLNNLVRLIFYEVD
jgi:hypothetical protein